jgi:L,D-peptidoglycan transpeptidase YkuD (ErfK/YbiS/YcfS/YnhG family)
MSLLVAAPLAVLAVLGLSTAPTPFTPPEGVETNPCARLNAGEVLPPTYGANRVTFSTAKSYGDIEVLITGCANTAEGYVQEWQTTGFAGRSGFAPPGKMWQDTLYSPSGSFSMTEAIGRENPGTKLEYHTINRRSRWGGESGPTYNQYFEGKDGGADENLWFYLRQGDYEQAAVINWNREPDMPTVQGASFAIFLHAGNAPTVGCISTDLDTVTRLLQNATPGDRIVMGVESTVFSTGSKTIPDPRPGTEGNTSSPKTPTGQFPARLLAAGVGAAAILAGAIVMARNRKHLKQGGRA